MENNDQRAIDLYNSLQKKKQELKEIQKQYNDFHKFILEAKVKTLQADIPDVNLIPAFEKKPFVVGLNLHGNNWDCRLYLHYSDTGFCCGAISNGKILYQSSDTAHLYDEHFTLLAPNFVGIFEYQTTQPDFYSKFLPYQYDEAFECFVKAYNKFVELGGEGYEITKKEINL